MSTTRRQFIGATASAVAASQISNLAADETAKRAVRPKPDSTDPVALIQLTDKIRCSRIGFGTGMRGSKRESDLTRAGMEKATDMLRFAYDNGVRLFDMADLYGTHPFVTEALKGKPRDSYTLISKIWVMGGGIPEAERPDADVVVERFLKECKTDYIDLIQLHCMFDEKWATQWAGQMEKLTKLKEQGKIRAHGCSTHSNKAVQAAVDSGWADAVHVRINSEGERMEGKPDDPNTVKNTVAVAEAAHNAGIGTIAIKVVGEGVFRDKPELRKKSTAFVTNLPCIDVMVVGFTEKEHITEFIENVAAALKK
ncbi:MAG: aldo/keto reductase [Planctomycetaceae bacterium]|nr:aldo/keto reductase [Planctomycetaceae bacterium]